MSSVTYYDLVRARLLERYPGTARALMILVLISLACLAMYLMYDLVSFASDTDHEVLLAGIGNRIGGQEATMPVDDRMDEEILAGVNLSRADEVNSSADFERANLSLSNASLSIYSKENNSSLNKSKELSTLSSTRSHSSRSSKKPANITDQNNLSDPDSQLNQTSNSRANETTSDFVQESGNNSNESWEKPSVSWRDYIPSGIQDLIDPEDASSSREPAPLIQAEGDSSSRQDLANQTPISRANEITSAPVEESGNNPVEGSISAEDEGSSREPTATIHFGSLPSAGSDLGFVSDDEDLGVGQSILPLEMARATTRQAQKAQEIRSKQAEISTRQSEIRSKQAEEISAKQSDVRSKQAEVSSRQSDVRSRQAEISSRQSDVRSRQAEISSRQSDVRSRQAEISAGQSQVGSGQSETTSSQSEVGSGPSETTSSQSEVGSGPSETTSSQSEVGSGPSETTSSQSEARARQSEAVARMKQKAADMRAR